MGEVMNEPAGRSWRDDPAKVLEVLRALNPAGHRGRAQDAVRMYADAFRDYRAAQANVDANGSIVAHPRTGAPIENPFLKVREAARRSLLDLRAKARLKVDPLWSDDDDAGADGVSGLEDDGAGLA